MTALSSFSSIPQCPLAGLQEAFTHVTQPVSEMFLIVLSNKDENTKKATELVAVLCVLSLLFCKPCSSQSLAGRQFDYGMATHAVDELDYNLNRFNRMQFSVAEVEIYLRDSTTDLLA
jgi:hypothetical protein